MGTSYEESALKHKLSKTPVENIPEAKIAAKKLVIKSFCAWDGDVLVLNILGTPGAKKDAIGKPKGNQLKISVTAAPVAGKATDHMVRFLAEEFDVTVKDIEVVFGRMNVNKQLRIYLPKIIPTVISNQLFQNKHSENF